MIATILNCVKSTKNESEIWSCLFTETQRPDTFCSAVYDSRNPNANVFLIHRDNEVLVVECSFARSGVRTKFDELIDEVAFSEGEEPLWFSDSTHRVSPVYHLRRYIKKVECVATQLGTYPDLVVKGLLLVNTNLINYDSVKGGYEKLGVVIKDNIKDPLREWDKECLYIDPFLDYATNEFALGISKIDVESMEIPEDSKNEDPYKRVGIGDDDDDDEDDDDLDFEDIGDILEWKEFDMCCNSDDDDEDESDEDDEDEDDESDDDEATDEPGSDKGRVLTYDELRKFLRSGTTPISLPIDMEMPSVEIYYPLPNAQDFLDGMTGLQTIKDKIYDYSCLAQYNRLKKESGTPDHTLSLHAVFTGNPGTGKSTMGRIWASLLHKHGQLSHGHFILATRSSFVGTKWGMEEENLTKILTLAEGGVLMIDEAYSLVSSHPNDPGRLVLPLLLNRLADEKHRNISVILAGYPAEMEALLKTNPGITSRFPNVFEFKDFTFEELCDITLNKVKYFDYNFTPTAWTKYKKVLAEAYARKDRKHFGNARFVVNYLEQVYLQHAKRVISRNIEPSKILRLTADDIVPYEYRMPSSASIGFDMSR